MCKLCANIYIAYMAIITIFLDDRRPKKTGLFPVKLRVTHHRTRKYFSTPYDLSLADYDRIVNSSRRLSQEDQGIRTDLNRLMGKAIQVSKELHVFNFDAFTRKFDLEYTTKNSLNDLFQEYIQELNQKGQVKTSMIYQTASNSINSFHKGVQLVEISPEWLGAYSSYLVKKSLTSTSISIYFRCLRSIYNRAMKKNLINRDLYPFTDFVIPSSRNKKKALNLEQIGKIMSYNPNDYWEDRAKDFFLLSYFCNGLNFADLLELKYANLDGDFIIIERHKTLRTKKEKEAIRVFLLDQAKDLINKWKSPLKANNQYLFHFINSSMTEAEKVRVRLQFIKMTNQYMRQIAAKTGIKDDITTYTARHSFATILKNSGSSMEYISEALGHSDLKTTKNYLKSFEDETLRINQAKLLPELKT